MSFDFHADSVPLLISFPHDGSEIPEAIAIDMTDVGRQSRDTDWLVERLYRVPVAMKASRIVSRISRYVIDLNRPVDDESLYPGQTTTGLVPRLTFGGLPIWNRLPGDDEIRRRIEKYWRPYHTQVDSELERLVDQHGRAVLLEAHSIASHVPRLFDGKLPDFNIGTHWGDSCAPGLSVAVEKVLAASTEFDFVFNGRFVGGFITRHFGQPDNGRHALQIEISQATYLDEETLQWADAKAVRAQGMLTNIVEAILKWLKTTC